jgi:hypothetical protein
MWLRVSVLSRGPVLIMFKIDPKFNLGKNTEYVTMTTQLVADIKSCQQNILAPVYFHFNNTIYYIVSLMYE